MIACAHKEEPVCSLDPEQTFQFLPYGLQSYYCYEEPSFSLPVLVTFCAKIYFKNKRKKKFSWHILQLNSAFNQLCLAISYFKSECRWGVFFFYCI